MSGRSNFEDTIDAWMRREMTASSQGPRGARVRSPSLVEHNEAGEKYDLSGRAYVMVLHHNEFDNARKNRQGSEKDMEKIRTFFRGYRIEPDEVEVCENLPLRKVKKRLGELSRQDFRSNCCLINIILSHGGEGDTILARDGEKYYLEDVVKAVTSNTTLSGKPKLFIVNACRGNNVVDSVAVPYDTRDTVIFQSTFEGDVSYRHVISGSFFVQTLLDVLQERDDIDIGELNQVLSQRASVREHIQHPVINSCLTKRLILRDLRQRP